MTIWNLFPAYQLKILRYSHVQFLNHRLKKKCVLGRNPVNVKKKRKRGFCLWFLRLRFSLCVCVNLEDFIGTFFSAQNCNRYVLSPFITSFKDQVPRTLLFFPFTTIAPTDHCCQLLHVNAVSSPLLNCEMYHVAFVGWMFGVIYKLALFINSTATQGAAVIRLICSYGKEPWGCTSKSNKVIMLRSQPKILRATTNAPRYVTNHTLHTDFNKPLRKWRHPWNNQ